MSGTTPSFTRALSSLSGKNEILLSRTKSAIRTRMSQIRERRPTKLLPGFPQPFVEILPTNLKPETRYLCKAIVVKRLQDNQFQILLVDEMLCLGQGRVEFSGDFKLPAGSYNPRQGRHGANVFPGFETSNMIVLDHCERKKKGKWVRAPEGENGEDIWIKTTYLDYVILVESRNVVPDIEKEQDDEPALLNHYRLRTRWIMEDQIEEEIASSSERAQVRHAFKYAQKRMKHRECFPVWKVFSGEGRWKSHM